MLKKALKSVLIYISSFLAIMFLIFFMVYHVGGRTILPTSNRLSRHAIIQPDQNTKPADYPVAYFLWLKAAIHLEFGTSLTTRQPVSDVVMPRLLNSVILNVFSLLIIFAGGISIGMVMTLRSPDREHASELLLYALYSIPDFVLGVLLLSVFAFHLNWFPSHGIHDLNAAANSTGGSILDLLHHLTLPAITLSASGMVFISRFTKSSLTEILDAPFVFALKSRGISQTRITCHVIKNGIFPFLTLVGFIIPSLVGGAVIVESLFSFPGIGKTFFDAVLARDYPVILAITFIDTIFVFVGLGISNALYRLFDPRVRYATPQ